MTAVATMLAAGVFGVACSLSANPLDLPGSETVVNPHDASAGDATIASDVAEAGVDSGAASTVQGNPLCNASRSLGCYPDDSVSPMTANGCAPDGGLTDSGAALACHVEPGAQGPHAVCLPAGTGTEGSSCTGPMDCAPAFECVVGASGGVCRPYCCSGQDRCSSGDAGAGEFCDIQTAVPEQTSVPVCMPVRSCKLLSDHDLDAACTLGSTCCTGETCAVVSDNGATSCVAVGKVPAGGACETDHCAADLVCLGTPGQRRCYQLCLTAGGSNYDCPSSQTCKGGLPLFPDTRVGICQ